MPDPKPKAMSVEEAADALLWTNPAAGEELPNEIKAALSVLSSLVEENAALRAEVERLSAAHKRCAEIGALWVKMEQGEGDTWKARAEKAEAELDAARPLLDIRPEVVAFARLMEDRLQVNEHKGGWKACRLDWLLGRLKEETAELEHELDTGQYIWVDKEAADVGNFAMMITDVAGRLAYRAREGKEPK